MARKKINSKANQTEKTKPKNVKKDRIRRIAFITIGVLLLASAFLGYQYEKMKKSPKGFYANHYEIYPNKYFKVKTGNTDVLNQAFYAYENGDYKTAAELLGKRIETSNDIGLKFYQAMAYGEMGNRPLAIRSLEDIKRFSSDYIDKCYWYLGLYYMKQENKEAAIENFQTFFELSKDKEKKEAAVDAIYMLQAEE